MVAATPVAAIAKNADAESPHVKDYITKIKNFNQHFEDDIVAKGEEYKTLISVTKRLHRVQRVVGYGNFGILSFDNALYYASRYSSIGKFPRKETEFLEQVFYRSAKDYGFYGEKVLTHLTDNVPKRSTTKVAGTGHYIFRGDSQKVYQKIIRDVGQSIILTSGVRGIVKQMYLFLNKAVSSKGNLSMASRSLAPPGHSFHGVGDFDVGKKGYGYRNFTEDFAETQEFKRLKDLGYVRIRYPENNPFGVRFEPWHIKVII